MAGLRRASRTISPLVPVAPPAVPAAAGVRRGDGVVLVVLCAERAFLRECMKAALGGDGGPVAAPLPLTGLDWERVVALAEANAVAPLVHYGLKAAGREDAAPDWAREQLARAYYRVAGQNARAFRDLRAVLDACHGAGIRTLVLKGAALAETAWQNLALRPMADVDLLVTEADLDRVSHTLAALGYVSHAGRRSGGWYRTRHHHLAPFHKPADGLVMEIHRDLVRPNRRFRIDVAGVWRRARPCRIAGANAAILCPDDFLVHLCLHLAFDEPFVGKIRDVVDIARLLQLWEGQIDWPRLISEAHARGYAGLMYYALSTVVAMLDARVNREVLDAFRRDITQGWWEDRLLKFIVSRSVIQAGEPDAVLPRWVLQEVCTTLLSNDAPGRRLRSLLDLTCAPVRQPEAGRPSPGPSGSSLARPSLARSCETGLRLGARMAKALGRRLRAARAS